MAYDMRATKRIEYTGVNVTAQCKKKLKAVSENILL